MNCPACGTSRAEVMDSRAGKRSTRRRRWCKACGQRFTTVEYVPPETMRSPTGRLPLDHHLVGISAIFDVRVHARFIDGQLELSVPPQTLRRVPVETTPPGHTTEQEAIDGCDAADEGPRLGTDGGEPLP